MDVYNINDEIHWYTEEMGTTSINEVKLKKYLIDLDFKTCEIEDAIDNQIELGMITSDSGE